MSSSKLSYPELTEYMRIIMEIEKNIYINQQTRKKIGSKILSLGNAKYYDKPKKTGVGAHIGTFIKSMGLFFIFSLIVCVVVFVLVYLFNLFFGGGLMGDRMMNGITKGFNFGVVGAIITMAIGVIVNIYIIMVDKKEYKQAIANYELTVSEDNDRVRKEKKQQEFLKNQWEMLVQNCKESESRLKQALSYGILDNDYTSLTAVATIYQYLKSGRTRSLGFDPETGDKGAYNIYKEELLLGKILTNTEVIISKLDQLLDNQRELKMLLKDANNRINTLTNSTYTMISKIDTMNEGIDKLNNKSDIAIYCQEETNRELRYSNYLENLKYYK